MFCDIALAYDPVTCRADLVFDGRNFVVDGTAATALIVSVGTERRAAPDDVLPGTVDAADTYANSPDGRPNPRRGAVCDAYATGGQRIGCRTWLLDDAKESEDTRQAAISYLDESTGWIPDACGVPVNCDASWIARNVLAMLAQAGGLTLRLPVNVG